jgi:hypothetical protein
MPTSEDADGQGAAMAKKVGFESWDVVLQGS